MSAALPADEEYRYIYRPYSIVILLVLVHAPFIVKKLKSEVMRLFSKGFLSFLNRSVG